MNTNAAAGQVHTASVAVKGDAAHAVDVTRADQTRAHMAANGLSPSPPKTEADTATLERLVAALCVWNIEPCIARACVQEAYCLGLAKGKQDAAVTAGRPVAPNGIRRAGAWIFSSDLKQVLLIKHSSGSYGAPKGRYEGSDGTAIANRDREVKEECGLLPSDLKYLPQSVFVDELEKDKSASNDKKKKNKKNKEKDAKDTPPAVATTSPSPSAAEPILPPPAVRVRYWIATLENKQAVLKARNEDEIVQVKMHPIEEAHALLSEKRSCLLREALELLQPK